MNGRISQNVRYEPGMNRLEDFDAIPHLERHVNVDPIETLRRLATADAMIMSRSSFSYVAAILSREGIAIYHPFWHGAMQDWLIAGGDGSRPGGALAESLPAWKAAAA